MSIVKRTKKKGYTLLRKSEKYFGTDMVYLTKGSFWLFAVQIFSGLASFIMLIAFTHYVSKEVYGTYRYVLSFLGLLTVFTLPGLNTAINRAIARDFDGSLKEGLRQKVLWGFLGMAVSFCISIYYYINGNDTLAISFIMLGLFLPIIESVKLYRIALCAKKLFKREAIYEIMFRAVSLIVMVIAIIFTNSVFHILLVFLGIQAIVKGFFLYRVMRTLPLNERVEKGTVKYAKHLSFMNVIAVLASQLDKILIFHYLGAVELAVYSVAVTPIDQLRGVVGNIRTLAFPKFSNQSLHDIKKTLLNKIKKLELVVLVIVVVYIVLAPVFFKFFIPQYLDSVIYSQVLAVYLLFSPRSLITTVLNAQKRVRELYIIRIVGPAMRIALVFPLLKYWGLWGAVFSVLLADLFLYVFYVIIFRRIK